MMRRRYTYEARLEWDDHDALVTRGEHRARDGTEAAALAATGLEAAHYAITNLGTSFPPVAEATVKVEVELT